MQPEQPRTMIHSRTKKKYHKNKNALGIVNPQVSTDIQVQDGTSDDNNRYIEVGKSITLEASKAIRNGQCTFREFLAKVDQVKRSSRY
jgi:hypothetical protein